MLVQLDKVSKSYITLAGKEVTALKDFSLSIFKGEFLTVIGPSGSGKSTLLQMLSGLEKPSNGHIRWIDANTLPRIGFVFQTNAIFPWRTIEQNLTYALEIEGVEKSIRKKKAAELCQQIGLSEEVFLHKYPKELSGGEQRRVAIGMALAHDSNLVLFDEPTSQLDYIAKWKMETLILNIWSQRKFTAVLVTHDLDEAILLGDRILLLENGQAQSILPVNLPRPREIDLLNSECVRDLKESIINNNELFRAAIKT